MINGKFIQPTSTKTTHRKNHEWNIRIKSDHGGTQDAYLALSIQGSVQDATKFTVWSRYQVHSGSVGVRDPARVMCTVFGS